MASETARSLRKRLTRQEVKLWVYLRELRKLGHHFRRQSPIPPYIVDFECRRAKLTIEIDGGHHTLAKETRRDAARDRNLRHAGYRVLRFWNSQVDHEFDSVMEAIFDALGEHPTRLAPEGETPSPEGEG